MLVVTPSDWGNIVRDRRRDQGLSQAQLAEEIGMSRQWIVRFENGYASTATLELLVRMADVLELDVELNPS
ncbi:helix-turn-helix transcriptional regulator [Microbacterium sp. JB110]|uniref:helix-turn-helix transcriptional regulator n=1 Tax=unclassified Microbacterium TaxID=2609290 RepID=UPI000E00E2E4|nr:helix-turn-helix transcriptional regulator [Microbacterium sp. JB110]RCS61786.1 XRE family transcriptional regulator [Microbacterium sp. JB110]